MDSTSFTKHKYIQLKKLQTLSASLLRARTLPEVASIIIDKGFDALGAVCGEILLYNENVKEYTVLAHKGYDESFISISKGQSDSTLLTDLVISTRKPYFIEDTVLLDKKYKFSRFFFQATNSKSAVLVPLKITNKTIGVLEFTFRDGHRFSSNEKSFIFTLADQCAQALDKIIALEHEKQAKDELETILKGVGDGVIVRNPKGEITYVNPAALRMHGCKKPQELLGLSLEKYFALFSKITDGSGKILSLTQVPFNEVFKEKRSIKKTFFKVLKKNNEPHWYTITSLPILNGEGKIEYAVSVVHDITEEKQNEYSKDEFFGIASHELKTPVTSLKAYTQVLQKRFEKEGNYHVSSFLQKMDYQIDKLTLLIRDLLDITKIEGGKLQFYNELFEFNMLAQEIVEEVQLTTEKHVIHLQKTKDVVIKGDRERIGQVITNFLTNAIKYSPDGKDIFVKVEKKRQCMLFSVCDFGIGIAQKDQKHIFERFYREKSLKGDTFPGLGLGLYIASEIIKRQNGKIWVESEKGKGSTFFFELPIEKPSHA